MADGIRLRAIQAAPEVATAPAEAGCCDVYVVDPDRVGRVQEHMFPDDLVASMAETFKALAHPTRVRILRALATEELCVCDLAHVLGMSISAVSHQLRSLRQIRLVRHRTQGKLVYYALHDDFVLALLEDGSRHLSAATTKRG